MYLTAMEMTILYLVPPPPCPSRRRGFFLAGKSGSDGPAKKDGSRLKCLEPYKLLCFSQLNRFTYQFPFRGL
jgi:hypothetical protein